MQWKFKDSFTDSVLRDRERMGQLGKYVDPSSHALRAMQAIGKTDWSWMLPSERYALTLEEALGHDRALERQLRDLRMSFYDSASLSIEQLAKQPFDISSSALLMAELAKKPIEHSFVSSIDRAIAALQVRQPFLETLPESTDRSLYKSFGLLQETFANEFTRLVESSTFEEIEATADFLTNLLDEAEDEPHVRADEPRIDQEMIREVVMVVAEEVRRETSSSVATMTQAVLSRIEVLEKRAADRDRKIEDQAQQPKAAEHSSSLRWVRDTILLPAVLGVVVNLATARMEKSKDTADSISYASAATIEETVEPNDTTLVCKSGNARLHLRDSPSIEGEHLGWITDGEHLQPLKRENGWVYVEHTGDDGTPISGWVAEALLIPESTLRQSATSPVQ